jgi:hypothetical protein
MLGTTYAANLDHDAEWASDWSMQDDLYTRSDATWIQELYEEVDIDGTVDDFANPFSFAKAYREGSRVVRALRQGRRLLKGVNHHAFFRFYTKF